MPEPARWATADDDAALRELCRRTPMRGPVSYTLEREPDFFALTRLQGTHGSRVAVITEGDEVIAMAMHAPMKAWVGGEVLRSAYLGDLKVHPEYRSAGLAGRILRFVVDELRRERIALSWFLVLAGNPMIQLMENGEAHFALRNLRAIRNFFLLFGSSFGPSAGVTVSPASQESIPEMIEVWNRVNGRRSFAPVLDERLLARWTSSSVTLGDFRVVRRQGRIVAFAAAWDGSAIKQIRLLKLSPVLRGTTLLYNLVAGSLHRPRFPRPGQQLRFLYVAHACAERAEDLEALLAHLHDEYRRDEYLYMDLALDCADPLLAAVKRFRSVKIDFELWEARTPTMTSLARSAPVDDCAYFDISLV